MTDRHLKITPFDYLEPNTLKSVETDFTMFTHFSDICSDVRVAEVHIQTLHSIAYAMNQTLTSIKGNCVKDCNPR